MIFFNDSTITRKRIFLFWADFLVFAIIFVHPWDQFKFSENSEKWLYGVGWLIAPKWVFRLAERGLGLNMTTECSYKNKMYATDKPSKLGV